MLDVVITRVRRRVASLLRERLQVPDFDVTVDIPPSRQMGDLAVPTALSLARVLRRSPRDIAGDLAAGLADTPGIGRAEVAGPGYVNLFLARGPYLREALGAARGAGEPTPRSAKVILEHTNINPNKAAHIGHLRNAALGDCLARCLRYLGETVEVQNYIDDTGVQVADLVVGFQHLRRLSLDEVRRIRERFDYHCWDLYAEVTAHYAEDAARLSLRADTLAQMEKGGNRTAEMAAHVADRIVRAHLRTMGRLGIRYDLLPKESDILAHRFWDEAFGRLKAANAVRFVDAGEKAGCWTMTLPAEGGRQEEEKIIVRSNGTVTYVGKDIAYQMWKFGLLKDAGHGTDFEYRRFHRYDDGSLLWTTTPAGGEERHPTFGNGDEVVNVIDSRQSYLQRVVAESLRRMGHPDKADRSIHFAYEMVALTPRCAREMGFEISEEDAARAYVEMSGRKGQGVKADDLIDRLIEKAAGEVRRRKVVADTEVDAVAAAIAIGALKYFLLKYGRNKVVAFDFEEVLAFEGETGPYVQYSVVRASNIFAKLRERHGYRLADLAESLRRADFGYLEANGAEGEPNEGTDHWELVLEITRLGQVVSQARATLELSAVAKHLFNLAQLFNGWYHKYRVLDEPEEGVRHLRILITHLFRRQMIRGLDLMGIEVPARM